MDNTDKIISISKKPEFSRLKGLEEMKKEKASALRKSINESIDCLLERETSVDKEVLEIMKELASRIKVRVSLEDYRP